MRPCLALAMLVGALAALASCGGGSAERNGAAGTPTSPLDTGPRAAEAPTDEALAKRGEALFEKVGCTTCHSYGSDAKAPDLTGVTRRRSAAWLERQILQPDAMAVEDPITRQLLGRYALHMPNLGVQPEEAKALIEHMKRRDRDKSAAQ